MKSLLRYLTSLIDRAFDALQDCDLRAREFYLAQATDHADLERRIRAWERRHIV